MAKLFGTDGIREKANIKLTIEKATKIAQAAATVLTKNCERVKNGERARMAIAWDPRLSSDMLVAALTAGFCSVGVDVIKLGVLPTPGLPVLMRLHNATAGVMVSASHNSFEDNGLKFFTHDGFKLPDEVEAQIEASYNAIDSISLPEGADVGRLLFYDRPQMDYIRFLQDAVNRPDLKGIKIALDCANGATFATAPQTFDGLGADVVVMGDKPDGININKNCGSTHVDALSQMVVETGADVGFAFDGDGDRCFAVDENGNIIDGDEIMSIIAMQMKKDGKLAHDTIISTVMVNLGFTIAAKEYGLNLEQVKVGDRYVLERMKEGGFKLGGEQSGHIILLEHQSTGDGILAALVLAQIMAKTGKKMSELNTVMTKLPQVIANARVQNEHKEAVMKNPAVTAIIEDLNTRFAGRGRVLVRPSGTETLIRVMMEGENKDEITKEAKRLAKILESTGEAL